MNLFLAMRDFPLSQSNRTFLVRGLNEVQRLDGRSPFEYRDVTLCFDNQLGSCRVSLGDTLVMACVSHEVVEPRSHRASEGVLFINLELSAMSASSAEPGVRPSDEAVQISRALECCLRDSKCLDLESLCIVAGEKVFQIRVDVRVLNQDGNLLDAAALASVAAMAHYRRPDVTVSGKEVIVHEGDGRDPVPLVFRFYPVVQSFGLFDGGKVLVADPSSREEEVMEGRVVVAMNVHRELCCLLTHGRLLLRPDQLLRCTAKAAAKVRGLTNFLVHALAEGTTFSSVAMLHKNSQLPTDYESDMMLAAHLAHEPTLEEGEVESEEEFEAEEPASFGDVYVTAKVRSVVDVGLQQLRSRATLQSSINSAIRNMRLEAAKQLHQSPALSTTTIFLQDKD